MFKTAIFGGSCVCGAADVGRLPRLGCRQSLLKCGDVALELNQVGGFLHEHAFPDLAVVLDVGGANVLGVGLFLLHPHLPNPFLARIDRGGLAKRLRWPRECQGHTRALWGFG